MFTDEPSPFRPRRASDVSSLTIGSVAVGATIGLYALFQLYAPPRAEVTPPPAAAVQLKRAPQVVLQPQAAPPVSPESRETPRGSQSEMPPARATIYLCKSYTAETFWSSAVCSTQRSTIDRMTTVPGHLTFGEQVDIARGEANAAARLYQTSVTIDAGRVGDASPQVERVPGCDWINQEIAELDRWARQPQSGQSQDTIRERRMKAMAARAKRGC